MQRSKVLCVMINDSVQSGTDSDVSLRFYSLTAIFQVQENLLAQICRDTD